jgi:hypothetical protein
MSEAGALHRIIRLVGRGGGGTAGAVRVVVEDDYHHFRVAIEHDGRRVLTAATQAGRRPYSLCDVAGAQLEMLIGMDLKERMSAVFRYTDPRHQCTHQFDMAALAVAAAARGTVALRYDLIVPDRAQGRTAARALRDGREVLQWHLEGDCISAPDRFSGLGIGAGFTAWVSTRLSVEEAEAALMLRRAVFISAGRAMAGKFTVPHAPASAACWVTQPARNVLALRRFSSWQNAVRESDELSSSDDLWLQGPEPTEH